VRLLVVALPLVLAVGCKCGADKPYTPFSVGDAAVIPTAAPSASTADVVDAAAPPPAFAGKRAVQAPAGAARWQIDGMALAAPAGRSFERGLAADFDGDGKLEAVTWTLPSAAGGAPGELWLHPSSGEPRKLATLPGFVPSGPGCRLEPSLVQTGPKRRCSRARRGARSWSWRRSGSAPPCSRSASPKRRRARSSCSPWTRPIAMATAATTSGSP
jgi:hypothetical protein